MLVKPEEVGLSSARLARIGEHLQQYVDSGKVAGTLTLIARRGHVAYWEPIGHLEIERRRPLTRDAVFRIYSMTKPITSVGLMMLYEQGRFQLDDPDKSEYGHRTLFSGGGGLVSTAGDYYRFTAMLRNRGELDGMRLLGRKTVELMTMNHLPGGQELTQLAQAGMFTETAYAGVGFGLGFSVMQSPVRAHILGTAGEFAWGGAASTAFWIDPEEDLIVIFMTQLMPSSSYPLRRELRVLTYAALTD